MSIASEFDCGEAANNILMSFLRTYFEGFEGVNGNSNASIINSTLLSSSSSRMGMNPNLAPLDMRIFIDNVLVPVSAEIARL